MKWLNNPEINRIYQQISGLTSPRPHPVQNTVPPYAANLLMVMYCLLEVSQQVVCVAKIATCPALSSSFIQLSHQFQVLPEIMQKNKMICWHNFFTIPIEWQYGMLNTHHTLTHNISQPVEDRTSHLPGILLDPAAPLVLCACLWHDTHYQDCKVLDPHWAANRTKPKLQLQFTQCHSLANNGQPIKVLQPGSTIRHTQNHMHLIFKFSWDFQVSLTAYHGFIKLPHHFKCVTKVTTWLGLSQFVTHCSATKTWHFIASLVNFTIKLHIAEIQLNWLLWQSF